MPCDYEYEAYIEIKHNNRFDVVNAISRSERIKSILSDGEFSVSESWNPFTGVDEIEKEVKETSFKKKYNLKSSVTF